MDSAAVIALIALVVAGITFYFQFFWKKRGVSLTLLSAHTMDDQFLAKLCVTNTGDTPVVVTELIPMVYRADGIGAQLGYDLKCSPTVPVSVAARSHYLASLQSHFSFEKNLKLFFRDTPDLIPDSNPGIKYIVGGLKLSLITDKGKMGWAAIQLFQLGAKDGKIIQSSMLDRPIELFKYEGLRIAGE